MRFNGPDYSPEHDDDRLSVQHERIKATMLNNGWMTLSEIASKTKDPEASISAQLRHLRKKRFGSWVIEKRHRGDRTNGLYEYRLQPCGYISEYVTTVRSNKHTMILREVYKTFPQTRLFIMNKIKEYKHESKT